MKPRGWVVAAVAALCMGTPACGPRGTAGATAPPVPPARPADVDVTLFLIGDAGAPQVPPDSEPVLIALRAAAAVAPHPFIAFLGDNLYPNGLPDSTAPGRPKAERRISQELGVLQGTGLPGLFVPGNHDWDGMAPGGWNAIQRQGRYIAAAGGTGSGLLPRDGCPGPAIVDVGSAVRLVALDTQWWLQNGPKPVDPTSRCAADSEREVIDAVRAALRGAGSRTAVVVAHHPPVSGGPHGGHFEWQDHIFPLRHLKSWLWIPLPVLGSAYPIAREHGWSTQDVSGAPYRRMSAALDSAFAGAPPLIYAAGHDHALQVIAGTSVRYVLVSGAGTFGHLEHVATVDSTRFAESASGFMRVEFLHDGRARLGVTVVDSVGHGREEFALWLR